LITRRMIIFCLALLMALPACQPAATPVASPPAQPTDSSIQILPSAVSQPKSTPNQVQAYKPQQAEWPTNTWQTSTPEQQGMDSRLLAEMFDAIQAQNLRMHSLLVVRNGYLVTEAYFDPYTSDVRHTIESNTKSVIAALIGIAIDQGKIKSASEKMVDFFPGRSMDNLDERKKAITLRDLLSMTSGLDCADGTPAASGMYQTRLWVQYLQDLPMIDEPGKQWSYCSGASHLLSGVLQQVTGMDARTYANQYLFQPVGIAAAEKNDWASDPEGISNGIAGLYLTPRELAKLGYLYLHQGNWDGKQIVPAQWMADATREQAYIGPDPYVGGQDRRFGYMFSIFPEQQYYGYLGMGGQELFVLPEKNLVVVFTSSLPVGKEGNLLQLLNEYIIPSAQSEVPLPVATQADDRLSGAIQAATRQKHSVPSLPQTALDISGLTYGFAENPLGWKSVSLLFEPGSSEAVWKYDNTVDIRVGLDGIYRVTEMPGQKPVGARATWKSSQELTVDDINLGEFVENALIVKFQGDEITISIQSINFGEDPVVIHGTVQR
jgi:CubicO group peptidase (beta-lactamase class C family)